MACGREYYKDNTEICQELKDIVLSIDPTIPAEDLVINEYSDNTDVVFWLCQLLGVIGAVIPEPADDLAIYFVDGNNPNEGDGSVTNPYSTIDRVISRVTGSDGNPAPTGQVTIVVRGYEGANYKVTSNMWIKANWAISEGAKITADATLTTDYLFDQDAVVDKTYFTQIYGAGVYTLTGSKGFRRTSDISSISEPIIRCSVSFVEIDVTSAHVFYQNAGPYPSGDSLYSDYTGYSGSVGTVRMRGAGDFKGLITIENSRDSQLSINNIHFIDYTTGNGAGTGVIELGCQPFNTTIKGLEIQPIGATHKDYGILFEGRMDSLNIKGFKNVFTSVKTFTSLRFDNGSNSGVQPIIENVLVRILGTGGYFAGGSGSITAMNWTDLNANVWSETTATNYIGIGSGLVTYGNQGEAFSYGRMNQMVAQTPTSSTEFTPKSYVDTMKIVNVTFFRDGSVSSGSIMNAQAGQYRYVIGRKVKIKNVSLFIDNYETPTTGGLLNIGMRKQNLDGTMVSSNASWGVGDIVFFEGYDLEDTGGVLKYGFGYVDRAVDVEIDGSVTPVGIFMVVPSVSGITSMTDVVANITIEIMDN